MVTVNSSNIIWSDFSISKKNIIKIPYEIVYQSDDKNLEQYCFDNFNEVIVDKLYNERELILVHRMKEFLKTNFSNIKHIENHYFQGKWFTPINQSDNKIVSFDAVEFNCKMWDRDLPFLEIRGNIYFDLNKMIDFYFKKKYLKMKRLKTFSISIKYNIIFTKTFPLFLRYMENTKIKEALIKIIDKYANSNQTKNPLIRILIKDSKIKQIGNFKKKIDWHLMWKVISIEINDFYKISKEVVKGNQFFLLGTAGVLLKSYYDKKRNR